MRCWEKAEKNIVRARLGLIFFWKNACKNIGNDAPNAPNAPKFRSKKPTKHVMTPIFL